MFDDVRLTPVHCDLHFYSIISVKDGNIWVCKYMMANVSGVYVCALLGVTLWQRRNLCQSMPLNYPSCVSLQTRYGETKLPGMLTSKQWTCPMSIWLRDSEQSTVSCTTNWKIDKPNNQVIGRNTTNTVLQLIIVHLVLPAVAKTSSL